MKIIALIVCCILVLSCSCLAQEKTTITGSQADDLLRTVKSSRRDRTLALEQAKKLVEQGADVNVFDRYGISPLGYAADIGDLEMTKFLWSKGAKHDVGKERPLIVAAGRGRLDIVMFYIDQGVPINTVSEKGDTALQVATRWNQTGVVAYLKSKGAN